MTAAVADPVAAEPVPIGEPILITAKPADSSFMHSLDGAYDAGRNRFMVVMFSTGTTMSARIIGADGQPVSGVLTIPAVKHTWGTSVDDGSLQGDHDVVYNATTDEYFVTWSQGTGPNTQGPNGARWNTVFGQRFSAATGAPLAPAVQLNVLRGDSAWCSVRYPVAEYNPATGGYLVVWQHVFHNGRGVSPGCPGLGAGAAFNLELVHVSGAGVASGSPTVIPASATTASDIHPYVRIVRHSSGEFLVSYRVIRPGEYPTQRVTLRRVSAAGALVGSPVEIDPELQRAGAWAAERPDGNWLVLGYVIGGAVKAYVYTPALARVGDRVNVAVMGAPSPSGVTWLAALGDGTYAMRDVDDAAIYQLGPDGTPMGARIQPVATDRILVSTPGAPALLAGRGHPQRVPTDSPLRNAMVGQLLTFGPGPAKLGGGQLYWRVRECFAVAGLPGDVALVNLTPVGAAGAGNGQLVSSDVTDPPAASNVNFGPGTVDPNVAAAPIGRDGKVCFQNSQHTTVHLIADHLGTIAKSAITLATPLGAPARTVDTRSGLGGGLVSPNGRVCFAVAGASGDVALVNLTPVAAAGAGNGQLVSSDVTSPPAASNVNFGPGTVDPNVVAAPIGRDGKVCFQNSRHTSVHLVADHLGTIAKSAITLATASGAPARTVDTRSGLGGGLVQPSGRVCFAVAGSAGDVALVNLTPVGAAGAGNGQLVSSDVTSPPAASNVNFGPGTVDPNVAAAPIGADGRVCFVNSRHTSVHLVADHLGTIAKSAITLASPSGAPERRVDTRPVA